MTNGTACSDGSLCSTSDVCTAGVCGGTVAAASTLCAATVSVCDNGNLYCDGSTTTCPTTVFVTCPNADTQCHTAGSCNSALGSCPITTAKANGTVCNDGSSGTNSDACSNGTCVGKPNCTVDAQCAGNQYCNAGTCATKLAINAACTAASQCQSAVCSGSTCVSCDYKGIFCIGSNSANSCDDNNPGTTDTCNTGCSGGCEHATVANGTLCAADTNPCTTDLWSGGTCTHSAGNSGAVCGKSGDTCINDMTCTDSSTTCPAATNKSNGTVCDDNNSSTSSDVCTTGVCKGT